jgi:stearoyl-CoA desaturase (delta-9 desaturase)
MTATPRIGTGSELLELKPGVESAPKLEIGLGGGAGKRQGLMKRVAGFWLDSSQTAEEIRNASWIVRGLRLIPFAAMHLACLGVIWVGWSWVAVLTAVILYAVRMFAITGFYHRYFSHRTFRTSRFMQFAFGVLGCSAVQRGPLWWAAHHREHHRHSDQEGDLHSPRLHGFLWAHLFWFLSPENAATNTKAVPDLHKFPELRWIDRYDGVVPILLAMLMFGLGWFLGEFVPSWGTDQWQMLVWGFFISTVVCYHATYTINSLCHVWGGRRFNTKDDSRNNFWLALLTFGEGWHNNHHHFPGAARQGFYWWELDLTYYVLWCMSKVGIVWDLNPVPERVYSSVPRKE